MKTAYHRAMRKVLYHLYRACLKKDSRKLRVNLITESVVGGFISHWTDTTSDRDRHVIIRRF
ncbi:hypothetical protein FIV31_04875 [Coxiella endosymbiont of Ornithodoros amblus]|uniref:hypothetical protein n=1 Tax=Coxiella endosymbiont of Ornithodoros amblus TaxID=1656166 RepID=UPI00244DC578|nr:hypothetical protein [Coxiella endosymbiont of Ornithodoros amblus]MBW5802797.1 hypothetical protein [Coxiella endosymbiont of Ornithodoros amblus]